MWQKIGGWFKLLWDAGRDLEEHSSAIRELQHRNQRFAHDFEHLFDQNERLREELHYERELRAAAFIKFTDELEKMELRLRLQISEELRKSSQEPRA